MLSEKWSLKGLISKFKIEYLLILVFAVVLLIIFTGGSSNDDVKQVSTIDSYVEALEKKLSLALSKIDGAGKVSVVISVESGMQTVLATEKTTENGVTREEPFTVGGKTVVIKETYPEITGVLIVAKGANNLSTKVAIINATAALLDIESDKIQVLPMK